MKTYLALIRGINVGGKNKIPMSALRQCLENLGFTDVVTFIASGNVILDSDQDKDKVRSAIEAVLPREFKLDSQSLKVLVLTHDELRAVVDNRPPAFGNRPDKYHSDAIFLIDIDVNEALAVFSPRQRVDTVWPGPGVVYSQRLSAERSKSRLSKIMTSPLYKSMTIRSWNTTVKLLSLLNERAAKVK